MSGAMCLYLFGLSQKNIYVYGTGSMGTRIKKYLDYLNIPIAAFVDSSPDKWGQTIAERPVIAPDNLRNCSTNEIVIIGSSYEDEIRDILKKIQVPDSQVVNFPLAGAPVIWQS
jgi:FlaA1/EpsC-like NDP-sugar epimerase